jgi:drug/metabolite transporter (DMT)-like permease
VGSGLLDHEPRWLGPLALATIYVVWGSTYLAIRVMVEDIPPLLGAGVRFVVAGAIMYAWLVWRRPPAARATTPAQLVGATIVGLLLMFGGNGLVTVAEQEVPSGLAALLIASVPLWVILLRASYGRERVPPSTLLSVAVGFAGVALLVLPGDRPEGAPLGWSLLVVLAAVLWASGSFAAPRVERPADVLTATTWQMLIGGGAMVVVGLAVGEAGDVHLKDISADSWAAFIFLVFIGSIAAFTAYNWLLQHVALSTVATYAFVNPVIAVFLGWLILDEEITSFVVAGTAVIVASVAFVVLSSAERAPTGGRASRPSATFGSPGKGGGPTE